MKKIFVSLLFCAAMVAAAPLYAQGTIVLDAEQKPTAAQEAFVETLIAASEQDGYDAFWETVHPDSRACISERFKAITEMMNFRELKDNPLPPGYMVQVNELLPEDVKTFFTMMFGSDVSIPVVPTHSLSIRYKKDQGQCEAANVTKILYIAEGDDGNWYEAMPCPAALPFSAEELKERKAERDKLVDARFDALPEDIKTDLRKLVIEDGQRLMAVKLLAESGEEMDIARDIADKFCAE